MLQPSMASRSKRGKSWSALSSRGSPHSTSTSRRCSLRARTLLSSLWVRCQKWTCSPSPNLVKNQISISVSRKKFLRASPPRHSLTHLRACSTLSIRISFWKSYNSSQKRGQWQFRMWRKSNCRMPPWIPENNLQNLIRLQPRSAFSLNANKH
jgi:hypothetical protein